MLRTLRLLAVLLPALASATNRPAVLWVGTSLAFGYAQDSNPAPARLATLIGRPVVNGGVGGDRLANISSRYTQYYSPFPFGVCVEEGGTNDIGLDGTAGATVASDFLALADAMHTAGCPRVIGILIPPRRGSSAWDDTKEGKRLTANAAIVAGKSTRTWLVTVDSDTALGDGGTLPDGGTQMVGLRTAFDYGDHLHLSGGTDDSGTSGMSALAAAVAAQM